MVSSVLLGMMRWEVFLGRNWRKAWRLMDLIAIS